MKKILVVDDEPELVKAIEIRLKAANYDVITAYDGEKAAVKVQHKKRGRNIIIWAEELMRQKISMHTRMH